MKEQDLHNLLGYVDVFLDKKLSTPVLWGSCVWFSLNSSYLRPWSVTFPGQHIWPCQSLLYFYSYHCHKIQAKLALQGAFKAALLRGKCSNVHIDICGIYFATENHCLLLSVSASCVLMVSEIRGSEIPDRRDVTDLSRLLLFCKYLLALWNFHNDKTEII